MRRLLILLFGPLALVLSGLVLAAGPAAAVSPHFVVAQVTGITSNTITVSFKESGLGNSENSVTITVNGTAECINGGGNHPKASNKEAFSVSGVFGVSNGTAMGSETLSAAAISGDFRTGISALGSGELEAELASAPPGDGGVGGQAGVAEDG